jgi:parallel beta-helix repeat protein
MNKKIGTILILLMTGIVFMSGCVQEKAPTPVPNTSPTIVSTTQPSATSTAGSIQVSSKNVSTLIVAKSGGANYTKIQDAINNSNDGDIILVYSGTYYESVDVNKQLILKGVDTGGGKPVVNANGSESSTGAITLSAGNSVLEGFTATGAAYHEFYNSAGIWVNSHNNQIRNNTVSNNPYGIELYHYSGNNTLTGNNVSNNDIGIHLYVSSNNVLNGNNIVKNNLTGITLYYSYYNMIGGNSVLKTNRAGIYLYHSGNNTLSDNTASNNDVGIVLDSSSNNSLTGNKANSNNNQGFVLKYESNENILSRNNASDNNYGIYLNSSSNNSIYNNYFSYSRDPYFGDTDYSNYWNTTKTSGTNIVGGPYIGGNFWESPGRTGFSQTCLDDDNDGICDIPHMLDDNNSDYLPLAYKPEVNKAAAVLVEDTDFKFSNKCEIRKIPRASNGSLLACLKAGGEKINVTFAGTAVSVISFGSPNGGIIKVQIDGKEYPEINTFVTEETVPWTLESGLRVIKRIASNLQNTSHILTFEIANKSSILSGKPSEAGDIYIDAIEIRGE